MARRSPKLPLITYNGYGEMLTFYEEVIPNTGSGHGCFLLLATGSGEGIIALLTA